MTRENKLALVVGFGLILFVGILISDHFSVVRSQRSADLTNVIDDPLLVATSAQSSLIDLEEPKAQPLAQPPLEPVAEAQPESIAMGSGRVAPPADGQVTPLVGEGPQPTPAQDTVVYEDIKGFTPHEEAPAIRLEEFVIHDVKTGETLYAICKQHMGSRGNPQALADYNNIDDPASLRVGQRIRIPKGQSASTDSSDSTSRTPSSKPRVTYIVKDGDSLSGIAHRFLGAKGKWKKLYDMNRDVIDDPDNVKIGTVLRVS